jgi:hypothetical protein
MRDRPLDCSWGETILGAHGGAETMRDRPLDCSWGETILGAHGGAETMRDRPLDCSWGETILGAHGGAETMRDRPLDCSWGETILGAHGGVETMRDRPLENFGLDFMADGEAERPFFRKLFAGRRPISRRFMVKRRCGDTVLQKVHVRSVRQRYCPNKVHGETEKRRVHPLEGLASGKYYGWTEIGETVLQNFCGVAETLRHGENLL